MFVPSETACAREGGAGAFGWGVDDVGAYVAFEIGMGWSRGEGDKVMRYLIDTRCRTTLIYN